MTANLISYWRHKEDARHNLVVEAETERHNRRTEQYQFGSSAEAQRHNMATEIETNRSNLVYEGLTAARDAEVARHNVAMEQHNIAALNETIRHNQATEQVQYLNYTVAQAQQQEQIRHNQELETLESREVFTKQRAQDLKEQQFELEKTKYITDTTLDSGGLLVDAAKTITGLFGSRKTK